MPMSKRASGEVHVTVSQGVQQATVPEGIMSSSSPLDDLRKAGFTNITHSEDNDEYSESVPEGGHRHHAQRRHHTEP